MPQDKLDVVELEVRRRLADRLASAGVDRGRLSLEVLFMLPPAFVRSYVQLFNEALVESVKPQNASRNPTGPIAEEVATEKEKERGGTKDKKKKSAGDPLHARTWGLSGGAPKRHREHWVIANEQALHIKTSIDRKLTRLAREMARRSGRGPWQDQDKDPICSGCTRPLAEVHDLNGPRPRFCPWCGAMLIQVSSPEGISPVEG